MMIEFVKIFKEELIKLSVFTTFFIGSLTYIKIDVQSNFQEILITLINTIKL
jgi:hypothetical protein